MKHIEVSYHHIWELVTNKKLEVWKIDTDVNIVDGLTKTLLDHLFSALRRQMGLRPIAKNGAAKSEETGKGEESQSREAKKAIETERIKYDQRP